VATDAPTVVEYLPAAQSVHSEPPAEYLPAAQFVQLLEPAFELFPAGQLLQEVGPVCD